LLRRTLNLGILAHVDAGKTTLTERLLYAAGVIDTPGSVNDGSTQTDTLAIEQQRGITIKSAVVSFAIDDVTVNLIDTPGHPDFIAEVERVLSVLDCAVLVISAVEGVQPQTPLLMRALQRIEVPTILFVNKMDRVGADPERVVEQIGERLTPVAIPIESADDRAVAKEFGAQAHPVFFGSAKTGDGVEELMSGIAELLPAAKRDGDGPVSGSVFKIERGPAGEKIAYLRMFSGTVRTRDRLRIGEEAERKVTAIRVFEDGSSSQRPSVSAGEIAQVWGLHEIQIGDSIGTPRRAEQHHFAPPTLETVIVPRDDEDKAALSVALGQLAEQDPLIGVRQDDLRQELSVSLYGEVQKEVVEATLANDYGIAVDFRETTTICVERPIGTGAAVERIRVAPNPFLATVGLRLEPGPIGSGVVYELDPQVPGTLPHAFFRAIDATVHETLRQGLRGWQVTDCVVTLTHTGYFPRQSHAHQGFAKSMSSTGSDFRNLTPLVLMTALKQAGTVVCEPIHRFHLGLPADTLAAAMGLLGRLEAVPETPAIAGSWCTVEGDVRAARVHELRLQLPAKTHGEGVLEVTFDRYEPVGGDPPKRPRWDFNPLNREEYLLRHKRGGRLG
jgi:ribosomal protection tetracycline resistance protein